MWASSWTHTTAVAPDMSIQRTRRAQVELSNTVATNWEVPVHYNITRRSAGVWVAALFLAAGAGCTAGGDQGESAVAATGTSSAKSSVDAEAASLELSVELLDGYGRGLQKELEILSRPGRGSHYGVTMSKHSDEAAEVIEAAGLTLPVYVAVRERVDRVFDTLNFQGKIGPPRSIDLARASSEWKQRLAGDPFAELPEASATALRSRMDTLVPTWSAIVKLTAQNG